MLIEVTKEDIEKGKPQNAVACPIAIALERQTGHKWSVGVRYCTRLAAWTWNDLLLPPAAVRFVRAFDLGCDVAPFAFEVPAIGGSGRDMLLVESE